VCRRYLNSCGSFEIEATVRKLWLIVVDSLNISRLKGDI
jgi:hypothetical protein